MSAEEDSGWLSGLTTWIADQVRTVWDEIADVFGDAGVWVLEKVTDISSMIINEIPVPDFMQTYSLSGLLSSVESPMFHWAIQTFRIGECFTVIGLGVAFNLLRKLFTLGQW